MVHVRRIEGAPPSAAGAAARVPTFGHRGWLWNNAFLLYDRETDSVWHHLTGRAMAGPLRGARLARLPTTVTTWDAWRSEHPGTLVLPRPPQGPNGEPTARDVYAERNARLRFGFGLDVGGAARLYPFAALGDGRPVEEVVGGVPVVVAFDAAGGTAYAYDRRVGGRTLSFAGDTAGAPARPVLRERDGSGAWFLRSGRPVSGVGPPLRGLTGSRWEAMAWRLQHPHGTALPGE